MVFEIMNKFKHSGAFGDLIYSLPIVKHLGGGEFYLHLNQLDWIGKYFYNTPPVKFHQGRFTEQDYEQLKPLMEAQDYITQFEILTNRSEITHNLDRFRVPFVKHPGNYVDIYSAVFGITDPEQQKQIRTTPWLTVSNSKRHEDKTIVINRSTRWIPASPGPKWFEWQAQGWTEHAVFVGLPNEYEQFKQQIGWNIPYQQTSNLLELAEYIKGAEKFIGNQSVALSIAIGLGAEYYCEARQDLPKDRNECYFPDQLKGNYF